MRPPPETLGRVTRSNPLPEDNVIDLEEIADLLEARVGPGGVDVAPDTGLFHVVPGRIAVRTVDDHAGGQPGRIEFAMRFGDRFLGEVGPAAPPADDKEPEAALAPDPGYQFFCPGDCRNPVA